MTTDTEYDVALSFAGEDRPYVDRVAHELRDRGVKAFYDLFEEVDLWGKDLYVHLTDVYRKKARFTVIFISKAYESKLWTNLERRAAQARAFQESQEYILPARFDDTEIPGVLPTVGYVSLASRDPVEFAQLIVKKLVSAGGSVPTELVRKNFGTVTPIAIVAPTDLIVDVQDDLHRPIAGCSVTAQAENGTTLDGKTGADGRCILNIKTRRTLTLLVAHQDYPAVIIEKIDPYDARLVTLPRTDNIGSLIIHSTGYIPNLKGRLNPILDTGSRTYLYAENIAIDGGKSQPTTFAVNEPIELEDADGAVVYATIKHIAADVTLLQFTRRT